jgi:sensor histidine kinase YesM
VRNLLKDYGNDLEDKVLYYSIVIDYIQTLELFDNPGKDIFTLYISNTSLYENKYFKYIDQLEGDSFFQEVVKKSSVAKEIWSPEIAAGAEGEKQILLYRKILSYSPDQTILQVRIPFSQIVYFMKSIDFPEGTLVFYQDGVGTTAHIESYAEGQQPAHPEEIRPNDILLESTLLNKHKLVVVIPQSQINSQFYATFRNFILGLVFVVLIIFVASTWAARNLTSELNDFINLLKGGYDNKTNLDSIKIDSDDEIYVIKQRFKDLLLRNDDLHQEALAAYQHSHQLEMELLQSKLNPHLLYNSLSVIKWTALRNKDEKTVKLVDSLNKYYRAALNRGNNILMIRNELSMIGEYLKINEYAHSTRYKVTIRVEEDIQECFILKHLLQPLVENAVIHGLNGREGEKQIQIQGFRQGDSLLLEVEDNGYGIDRDTIDKIMSLNLKKEIGGYGLRNLISRIRTYYGPGADLTMDSEKGKYTRVSIKIPVVEEKELEERLASLSPGSPGL